MAVKSSPNKPSAKEPRQARPPKKTGERRPRKNVRFAHDMWGLASLALGAVLCVGILYHSSGGPATEFLASIAGNLLGIAALLLPVAFIALGLRLFRGPSESPLTQYRVPALLAFLVVLTAWHMSQTTRQNQFDRLIPGGGIIGAIFACGIRLIVNDFLGYILLTIAMVMVIVWAVDMRLIHMYDHAVEQGRRVASPFKRGVLRVRQQANAVRTSVPAVDGDSERNSPNFQEAKQSSFLSPPTLRTKPVTTSVAPIEIPAVRDEPKKAYETMTPSLMPVLPVVAKVDRPEPTTPQLPLEIPAGLGADGSGQPFVLPPLSLLNESPPTPVRQEVAAQEKQEILMRTLNDFKIGANVAQVSMGPTITRYEVQLEPGILVKKIVSLADNLAMSLAAIDVRVEAPIPGKSAIGIEVPNEVCQMVSLRECLSTNEFMNAASKLTFALGKDVSGEFKYADLARMPHLLVGGSTNSGKSVCLNVIISSILYRATPREVKFVMIDPKRVELSLYDGIPHLLAPVIKDVKQAAGILRSLLKEMEERYDRFARLGTRNIEGFNNRVPPSERLPFIVLVLDELADLMMQQGAEVETSICRLAQLARATGIHLVIATQRPSVDVITGTIKANISSRIAFAVATQVDSRTIIDMPGADRLIGRGDMLFMPIDAAKPVRVQGCYIGEFETEALVKYLRDQEEAVYTMIPTETSSSGMDGFDDDGSSDELFEPCVRWLIIQGQCSTSSLQRKFKIGYTRAARLVETMEARQIVGPQDGVKPREILLRPENADTFFAGASQGDVGQ